MGKPILIDGHMIVSGLIFLVICIAIEVIPYWIASRNRETKKD